MQIADATAAKVPLHYEKGFGVGCCTRQLDLPYEHNYNPHW
jgi:hypothetical protein